MERPRRTRTDGSHALQQERAHATRRALLLAAGQRFAEQGYHGTSLKDLLEEGTASKGALYFHFSSKEALAAALVSAMTESWDQVLPAVRDRAGDALEALVLLTDVVIVRLEDPVVAGAARILRDHVLSAPTLADVSGRWRAQNEELLREAADAGLLRPNADPAWVARDVVAAFAGRAVVRDASTPGETLWDQMNDFWAGALPIVACDEWNDGWAARPWRQRCRPTGVGPGEAETIDVPAIPHATGA